MTFEKSLRDLLTKSIFNNYNKENYDYLRFGPLDSISITQKFKNVIKKTIKHNQKKIVDIKMNDLALHLSSLEQVWKELNKEDQNLLSHIVAYRLLGHNKVMLPLNNPKYWKALKTAEKLATGSETYNPNFLHFILQKFDLNAIGYNIKIFFSSLGIAIDFIVEQYAYKQQNNTIVGVEEGDVVLDIGGCWGDTALYFAHKTGKNGKVYSFEFIPENIKLHNINTELNPELKSQIQLIEKPISDISDVNIYFKDFGPASTITFEPFKEQTGNTKTISIDDFIKDNNITEVDFIKMDIEGAETLALKGAIQTIKKYKPKLAIAIYHSFDDLVNIPKWILDLDLGYEIYLGHYTIHSEETILFAKAKV